MKASQVIKELAALIDNRGDREVSDYQGIVLKSVTYCEVCDQFVINPESYDRTTSHSEHQ
jgi:hypothetical protein